MIACFRQKYNAHTIRSHWTRFILTAAVVGTVFFLQAIGAKALTVHNVNVPGTLAWYDTGIFMNAGETLDIFASGQIRYGPVLQQVTGPGGTNYDGQQFFVSAVIPNATVVSLIGKIGGTATIGTGTLLTGGLAGNGPGYVGTSYHQTVNTSGELFLGFNDQISSFGDNSGSFNVTVTVPEPSSLALAGVGALVFSSFARRKRNA
jgi:hypothetical protein